MHKKITKPKKALFNKFYQTYKNMHIKNFRLDVTTSKNMLQLIIFQTKYIVYIILFTLYKM